MFRKQIKNKDSNQTREHQGMKWDYKLLSQLQDFYKSRAAAVNHATKAIVAHRAGKTWKLQLPFLQKDDWAGFWTFLHIQKAWSTEAKDQHVIRDRGAAVAIGAEVGAGTAQVGTARPAAAIRQPSGSGSVAVPGAAAASSMQPSGGGSAAAKAVAAPGPAPTTAVAVKGGAPGKAGAKAGAQGAGAKRRGSQTSPPTSKRVKPDDAQDNGADSSEDWEAGWQAQAKTLQLLGKLKSRMQSASTSVTDTLEAMKSPSWSRVAGWRADLQEWPFFHFLKIFKTKNFKS